MGLTLRNYRRWWEKGGGGKRRKWRKKQVGNITGAETKVVKYGKRERRSWGNDEGERRRLEKEKELWGNREVGNGREEEGKRAREMRRL